MYFIDPHIHMAARTTDDYLALARTDCIAVAEPAFWAGWDRSNAGSFHDYFRHITEFEPSRAAQFGIKHFAWMCVNAKEADNISLAREVIAMIPEFINRPNVLGIGEIGLNLNTKNEATVFMEQVDLAARFDRPILVHTPHLAKKYAGTRMCLDMLRGDSRIDPGRVTIDHVEEHTIRDVLSAGFWAGMTLYPTTKCTPQRAADMVEIYGPERLLVDSSSDWGPSRPSSVPDFLFAMRRRGHSESLIRRIVYENPLEFWRQSENFDFTPPDVESDG